MTLGELGHLVEDLALVRVRRPRVAPARDRAAHYDGRPTTVGTRAGAPPRSRTPRAGPRGPPGPSAARGAKKKKGKKKGYEGLV